MPETSVPSRTAISVARLAARVLSTHEPMCQIGGSLTPFFSSNARMNAFSPGPASRSVASADSRSFLAHAPAEQPVVSTSTSCLTSSLAMVRWLWSCIAFWLLQPASRAMPRNWPERTASTRWASGSSGTNGAQSSSICSMLNPATTSNLTSGIFTLLGSLLLNAWMAMRTIERADASASSSRNCTWVS